ncbi:hypothetical protein Naga_101594g1, partial [Nannochloropsis gaditana]
SAHSPSLASASSPGVEGNGGKTVIPWGPLPGRYAAMAEVDPSAFVGVDKEGEEEGEEEEEVWVVEEEEEEGGEFILAGGLEAASFLSSERLEDLGEVAGRRRGRTRGRRDSADLPSSSSFAAVSAPFVRPPPGRGREGRREGGREGRKGLRDLTGAVGNSLEEQEASPYGPMRFRSSFFNPRPGFTSAFTRGFAAGGEEGGREEGREIGEEGGFRAVWLDVVRVLDHHHRQGRGAWRRGRRPEAEEEGDEGPEEK